MKMLIVNWRAPCLVVRVVGKLRVCHTAIRTGPPKIMVADLIADFLIGLGGGLNKNEIKTKNCSSPDPVGKKQKSNVQFIKHGTIKYSSSNGN